MSTNAVHARGHIAGVLCEAVASELGPKLRYNQQGRVRVVLDRPDFGDLLNGAISDPRRYGSDSPLVLEGLAQPLRQVGWCVHDPRGQQAVRDQRRRLQETITYAQFEPEESVELTRAVRQIEDALTDR